MNESLHEPSLINNPRFDLSDTQKQRIAEFDWDHPDLSTLPKRMRYAATVLAEANERLASTTRAAYLWATTSLIEQAGLWEVEDRATCDRDSQVEELARELWDAFTPTFPDHWFSHGTPRADFRDSARKLIESGWHK